MLIGATKMPQAKNLSDVPPVDMVDMVDYVNVKASLPRTTTLVRADATGT